jgi:hypothetical protein
MDALSWPSSSAWRPIVASLMSDIVTDTVISTLRKHPPEYFVSHDSAWLDEATLEVGSFQEPDGFSVLAKRLPSAFGGVVAYHACRPEAPQLVAAEGLRVLDPHSFREHALRLFPVSAELIQAAIDEVGVETREGVVHLALDDIFLVQHCSHYLIYGSEYMQAVAANLQGITGRDFFKILRCRGIPTIFVCEVPLQMLEPEDLHELAAKLLTYSLESIVTGSELPGSIDFTLTLRQAVPPECIVHHYHPHVMADTHQGDRPFCNSSVSCSLCAPKENVEKA